MVIPSLENNPLAKRVVETFDQDKSGEVDFKVSGRFRGCPCSVQLPNLMLSPFSFSLSSGQEFIQSLSVFTKRGREEKYKCQSRLPSPVLTSPVLILLCSGAAACMLRSCLRTAVTFRVYDVDGDGYISNADLFRVLKAMVGSNLNDVQIQQLVDRTILQGDKDKDGKLNYEEFLAVCPLSFLPLTLNLDYPSPTVYCVDLPPSDGGRRFAGAQDDHRFWEWRH